MTGEKSPACQAEDQRCLTLNYQRKRKTVQKTRKAPLPKGQSFYASAKHAEYLLKDLEKAEYFYLQAILSGDRKESAVKDLASLLHQKGKTQDACRVLERFSNSIHSNPEKLKNLYTSLKKHLQTSEKQPKTLKLSGFHSKPSKFEVFSLFENSSRIRSIEFLGFSVLISFPSHSSARKTLESFSHWGTFKLFWISSDRSVLGEIQSRERISLKPVSFSFKLFFKDPACPAMCLPIDFNEFVEDKEMVQAEASSVLGCALASVL
jgi:hypothetical protein